MATGLIGTIKTPEELAKVSAPITGDPNKPLGTLQTVAPVATPQNVAAVLPGASPEMRDVTQNETVAGQLNTLLSKESPYIKSARNRGMEVANSRGLINSSLAAGTSERAAIDAALPIAQQDAQTYSTSGLSAQQSKQDIGLTGYKSLLDSAQVSGTAVCIECCITYNPTSAIRNSKNPDYA